MINLDHDFEKISEKFGTPLYLYDGNIIKRNFKHLSKNLHPSLEIFYSLKANPNMSIFYLLHSLGARAEVSSMAELMTVLKCGTNPKNIIFLGPGKSIEEIEMCVSQDIYSIVCESKQEMEIVNKIAKHQNKMVNIALRVNPSFSVRGARLSMSGKSSQFGIDEEQLPDVIETIMTRYSYLHLQGFQTYMGTRILDEEVILENTRKILESADRFAKKYGIALEMVDIGGGLGVPYFDKETSLDIEKLGHGLTSLIEGFREKYPNTRLIMELGRYLTAESGIYMIKTRYIKESRGEKYIVADGGTNHHMAAVGIGSFVKRNFPIRSLSNLTGDRTTPYNISGPLCTPNDTIGKSVMLPKTKTGDLIGILNSGAYGPSASPILFLSHGFPAEVLYYQGNYRLIRSRDTVDSMLKNQILYEFEKI